VEGTPDGKGEHITCALEVEGDEIVNDGKGLYLSTEKDYGDIELLVDYKMLRWAIAASTSARSAGADLGLH